MHGCCDKLETLLTTLGYQIQDRTYIYPAGIKAVFLGELIDRFVAHEPLRRVHECTFGVLALESKPIDLRLQHHLD